MMDEGHLFNFEKLPHKIPLVKSVTTGENPVNIIPFHCDAAYFLRRHLIDQAKKHFKELDRADTNTLLTHSHMRAKQLEDRIEE